MKKIFTTLALLILLCVGAVAQQPAQDKFPMVTIPESITEPVARASYLCEHYWDNVNFETISDDVLEQGFVDMVSIFALIDEATLSKAWTAAVARAEVSKSGIGRLLSVADKYLYGVSSPNYNESAYRLLLQAALVSKKFSKAEKQPYQAQLMQLEMNAEGTGAVDFEFTKADGSKMKLSDVEAMITILFFFNPDCVDCRIERFRLSQATLINYLQRAGGVQVVAIYPSNDPAGFEKGSKELPETWICGYDASNRIKSEGLYDLRAMPRVYLLNDKKQVALKNTTATKIETYLTEIMRSGSEAQKSEKSAAPAAE